MVGTAWSANRSAQSKMQTSCTYQMGRGAGEGMEGVADGGKGGVNGFEMREKKEVPRESSGLREGWLLEETAG